MKILYLSSAKSQQRQLEKLNVHIYPVLLAMQAEYYRKQGHTVHWIRGYADNEPDWSNYDKVITEPEGLPFLSLPHPDRVFTRAKEYTSGNYKYLPGTHMQVANGCWWGKCSFCVENGKPYEIRPVEDCIEEIKEIKSLGFRECFDDSGTFPTGQWLDNFCMEMYNSLLRFEIKLGCNMRIDSNVDFKMMKQARFRMLLFGLESANQSTLDRIGKGIKVEDIIPTIRKAAEAGLEPHIAVMFGYPWESDEDANKTLRLVHWLLTKGYAKTAQASFYTAPCDRNRIGENMESNVSHKHYTRRIYDVKYSPQFWFNQLKEIKDIDDIKYLWRKIKSAL